MKMSVNDFIHKSDTHSIEGEIFYYTNPNHPEISISKDRQSPYMINISNGRVNDTCNVNVELDDVFEINKDHFYINREGRSLYFHLKRDHDKGNNSSTVEYFITNILPKEARDLESLEFEIKKPNPFKKGYYEIPLGKLYSNSPKHKKISNKIKEVYPIEIESYEIKDNKCILWSFNSKAVGLVETNIEDFLYEHFHTNTNNTFYSEDYPFLKVTKTEHIYKIEDRYVGDYIEAHSNDTINMSNYNMRLFMDDGKRFSIRFFGNPNNKKILTSKDYLVKELEDLIFVEEVNN